MAAQIGARARVEQLDLADRAIVDAFVARWTEHCEQQFATNHLGHFRLAVGLHEALAADGRARIVAVSSSGHLRSPVIFDDLHYRFREYDPFGAYGQSKTANVLFAVGATERWAADGITANALNPGGIQTNLQRHVGGREDIDRVVAQTSIPIKTVEQGAATSVFLATRPEGRGRRRPLLRRLQRVRDRPAPRGRPTRPRRDRAPRTGPRRRGATLRRLDGPDRLGPARSQPGAGMWAR